LRGERILGEIGNERAESFPSVVAVEIRLARRFIRALDGPDEIQIAGFEDCLAQLARHRGSPHVHAGLLIRRLRTTHFECRSELDCRIVLAAAPEALEKLLVGNQGQVQTFQGEGSLRRRTPKIRPYSPSRLPGTR
jgi:hypothetical protein